MKRTSKSKRRVIRQCESKTKLRRKWADDIIDRAAKDGKTLFKYSCKHCQCWHLTKFDLKGGKRDQSKEDNDDGLFNAGTDNPLEARSS